MEVTGNEILFWRANGYLSDYVAWMSVEERDWLKNFRWTKVDSNRKDGPFPRFQHDLSFTVHANALRSAWALRATGDHYRQISWQPRADALVEYLLEHSIQGLPGKISLDGSTAKGTLDDAAATAYWANHWISDFPSHPATPRLKTLVRQTLEMVLEQSELSPPRLAFATQCLNTGAVSSSERQEVSQYIAAPFHPQAKHDSAWLLEAASQIAIHSGSPPAWLENQVERLFDRQNTLYADDKGFPVFGAFRGVGLIAQDNARIASALAKLACVTNNAYWLDRAAFAMRSQAALWSTLAASSIEETDALSAGLAWPGYGNERFDQPDRRTSWESAEGLYVATAWEVLNVAGSYFQFESGEIVGIEGIGVNQRGNPADLFRGNPLPFDRPIFFGWKEFGSDRTAAVGNLVSIPRIVRVWVEDREGIRYLIASPGLTLTGIELSDVEISASIGGKKREPAIGLEGFEWVIPNQKNQLMIRILLRYGTRTQVVEHTVEPVP